MQGTPPRQFGRTAVFIAVASVCASALAQTPPANPATVIELPSVEVVGTTPLPGLTTPLTDVPGQVQSLTSGDIVRERPFGLHEYLERNVSGLSVGHGQGNPLQPEVVFRGFTASPLLGSPQGLSVYLDGVRMNEAFGDSVNWDLIPTNAISSAHLLSGSNPVFGLNTLGGALTLYTKSGFSFPGASAQASAGSFGRRTFEAQLGGHGERADGFVAIQTLDEDGWRKYSGSQSRQFFGKTGWQDDRTDIDFSLAIAETRMRATQALPRTWLDDRRGAYTWPDQTDNTAILASLRASRYLTDTRLVSANLYLRNLSHRNVASNVNDRFDPLAGEGPGNSLSFFDRSKVEQRTMGLSVQMTDDLRIAGRPNRITLGAAMDSGRSRFSQFEREATFDDTRQAIGTEDPELQTRARTVNTYYGVYAVNSFRPVDGLTLQLAGRYNVAKIRIRDDLGTDPQLDGDHTFRRFNPAIGVTVNPDPSTTVYASYHEGMRAPSPMELTCADPATPCRLPTAFLADPPLNPVIAKTVEGGWRARFGRSLMVSGNAYRTELQDDIQFVSSGGNINAGYFQNIGKTRRIGADVGVVWTAGALKVGMSVAAISAKYVDAFTVHSPNNSSADANGDIRVNGGNRIPGVPTYTAKLRAEYAITPAWYASASLSRFGPQYARGDENNQDTNGRLPAYHVVNLATGYSVAKGWEIFAKVDNVFDRKYESLAVLGENFFNGPGRTFDAAAAAPEQFRTPGAPRAVWVGVRFAVDGRKR